MKLNQLIINENIEFALLSLIIGIFSLIVGLRWKKPNWGGGIVNKYSLIMVGILGVINAIILFFKE